MPYKEIIQIGEAAELPVHISHIKALGADVWGKSDSVIQLVRQAQEKGINITANQYPYTASSTGLVAAAIPRWAEAGGRTEMLETVSGCQVERSVDEGYTGKYSPAGRTGLPGDVSLFGP